MVVLTVARSKNNGASGCAMLIGGLLVIGLILLIIKWAAITAAILAVPFGVWWVYDHRAQARRRQIVLDSSAPVDPAREARIADDLGILASAQMRRGAVPADDTVTRPMRLPGGRHQA